MASSAWFAFSLGGTFFILIYYIPIWFQAIKGVSAMDSGIRNLPMILALVLFSIVSGGMVTALGYYTPFMIASSVLMTIGAGLISMFEVDTGKGAWIGYQILYGAGVGFGMQQALIAAQTVLHIDDVPVGTSLIMFMQTLGGALFVAIGQNIFTTRLLSNLASKAPGFDSKIVLRTGATNLKVAVINSKPELLPNVLIAYNEALRRTFYVSLVIAALSLIGAVLVEWKSVKGKKIEAAMA